MWRSAIVAALVCTGLACGKAPAPAPEGQAAAPAAGPAEAPTGEAAPQWLALYRTAAGGEALSGVRTLRMAGVMIDPSDRANRRIVVEAEYPAKYRQTEGPLGTSGRRHRTLIGFNGTEGWWAGDTRLGGDGLSKDPEVRQRAINDAARQNQVNFIAGVLPAWLPEGGVTLSTIGDITDGPDRGLLAIALSHEDMPLGRLLIDQSTHLPSKLIVPYQRHIRPEGGEYEIRYWDYRPVAGVLLPHRIARRQIGSDGSSGSGRSPDVQWSVSAYQVNVTLEGKTFEPIVPRR